MTIFVFLGPTLSREDASREIEAELRPPAAVGDVYRVACRRPRAIGIIDGYFESVPSVWHKEILFAMSEGIHVFGAASMGALRAAELGEYGMHGVGRIYSAFRSGELEDDDEVAVAHATAEHGYRALSEAMVNIRATLAAAAMQGIITDRTRSTLESIAKRLFYADRSFARIVHDALEASLPVGEIQGLREWLPKGRVDAKRDDAIAMLREMRRHMDRVSAPMRVGYRFEHTHTWQALQRHARALDLPAPSALQDEDAMLDELRLRGKFVSARHAALGRLLALAHARESGKPFTDRALDEAVETLRRDRGLFSAEDFQRWLSDNGLDAPAFAALLRDQARFAWVESSLAHASTRLLADQLRIAGEYASLRLRVQEKEQILSSKGVDWTAVSAPDGLDDAALWRWYFTSWLQLSAVPEDMAAYAAKAGFEDEASLRRAVLREYLVDSGGRSPGPSPGGASAIQGRARVAVATSDPTRSDLE